MSDKEQATENTEAHFSIEKIYLKDVSFEAPNSPAVFTEEKWEPEVNVQLNSSHHMIAQDVYEVILNITITAKQKEKTAFLVELKQAGIFTISGFPQENLSGMLGAFCPEALFPFAREAVADFINKGGFQPLLLAPINFNALYAQQMEHQQAAAAEQESAH